MLQAIVFDFDGVLVDSEPLHFRAFQLVGRELGIELDFEQYLRTYVGFDDRDALRAMLESTSRPVSDAAVAELCRQKQVVFDELVTAGVPTIAGAMALVDESAGRLPIAVASGATRQDIRQVLEQLHRVGRFSVIVTADDVARSKPDPQTYRLAVEKLAALHPGAGIVPRHCLAIEDTAAGIASARGAGLMTLGLTTTTGPEGLRDAQRVIPDLANVTLAQLQAWYAD